MTQSERQLALDVARLEQREAMLVFNQARAVENSILREEYLLRTRTHFQGLMFGIDEVFTQSGLLLKYAVRGLKLWMHS